MLTDTKLRNLKPKDKLYKVNDRDGLYVAVTPAGAISFRYNYAIHGRQETITFGRYGVGGITLSEARERLGEAKKMIAAGKSPAKEKARDKARVKDAETFGAWAEKWLRGYQMADSTRDMRRSVYERELKPKFGNQKLLEITHEDLRALTDAIVERGAPATAVHAREVVLQVFRWAIERGQKVENPAELVRPTTIAKFEPRDRALTPDEIGLMYQYMERIGTTPSIRAAAKLLLLTMVRKSELTKATWSEISFSEALWTIPKERMKRRNPHLVFLSRQALDIFIALKTFAGGSDYVLPSRYDSDTPMSSATLNQVLTLTYRLAQKEGKPLTRLRANAVEVRQGGHTYIGGLIARAAKDEETHEWVIELDAGLRSLFAGDQFTQVQWAVRRELDAQPLAQWLHGFYASHAAPYPMRVDTLHRLCGSEANELWKFAQTLRKALEAVAEASAAHGEGFDYVIRDGRVAVEKQARGSQRRHLAKKARAVRKSSRLVPFQQVGDAVPTSRPHRSGR